MDKLIKLIAAALGITMTCFVGCTGLSLNLKSSITKISFGPIAGSGI